MKKLVMIVEDDSHIRLGLKDALEGEGYDVAECGNGREAMAMIRERKPAVVLLDVMLPGKSGFDVCRELRAEGNRTPVLMLTAKGQEIDKVVGLELGADDYVTKPFSLRELVARVQALLRRAEMAPDKVGKREMPVEISFGNVRVQTATMRGKRGKVEFELTKRELDLLCLLFLEAGNVVSRNRILDEVWGMEYYGTTRTLDQVVVKLRQKVEAEPSSPAHLLTVHGVGYRLDV